VRRKFFDGMEEEKVRCAEKFTGKTDLCAKRICNARFTR
jgi:hypothetical protein